MSKTTTKDKVRELTDTERETIILKYNDIRIIAWQNVQINALVSGNAYQTRMNMEMDAKSYGWNDDTVNAMREALDLMFS